MAVRTISDETWDNDEDAADASDEESETQPCPHCHRQIYEDAEWCPHCGDYVVEDDADSGRKPWWVVAGVLLCLVMVLWWIVSGF